ncbi:MAG: hypothetical protein K2H16_02810 [Prevotella sp.]|nr:hypothetical protein [Prevotella sp.]
MEWLICLAIALGVFCLYGILGWGSSGKPQEEHTEPTLQEDSSLQKLSQVDEELSQVEEEISQEEELLQVEQETRDTMLQILRSIGCQPVVDEDGDIAVYYQGAAFDINFYGRYANIWDLAWDIIKIDEFEYTWLYEAANAANFDNGPTVVVDVRDNGTALISSFCKVMLHPVNPENTVYVRAVLESFFKKKEGVRAHFAKIYMRENGEGTSDSKGCPPFIFTPKSQKEIPS